MVIDRWVGRTPRALTCTVAVMFGLLLSACTRDDAAPSRAAAGATRQPLVGQGVNCGGCDPACFVWQDTPLASELTADNAVDLAYDETTRGLVTTDAVGTYTRVYDGFISCEIQQYPYWDQLYWDADAPTGTGLRLLGRTARSQTELEAASFITFATIPADYEPAPLDDRLAAADLSNGLRYFEIRAELTADDGGVSPTLHSLHLVHYCLCSCDTDSDCNEPCDCDQDCGSF